MSVTMTTRAADQPTPIVPRAVWIDRLRASLILLVILHHAAITYGASGSWIYKATEATNVPLTFLAAVNQAFFMGLFFMISGALAPVSLERKGAAAFLGDRAIRLGVPVLVFGLVLGPLTVALASAPIGEILADTAARILRGSFILGPLWFPAALLVFSVVFAVWPAHGVVARAVPPGQGLQRLAHRGPAHAVKSHQVALGGQLVAGRQFATADALQQAVAVEPRHADVGEDQLDARIDQQGLPARLAVRLLAHLEAAADVLDDGRPHHARVVDDQDPGQGLVVHGHLPPPSFPTAPACGRPNRPERTATIRKACNGFMPAPCPGGANLIHNYEL